MIKHLQRRLITLLTFLLSLILIIILVAINFMNYSFNLRQNRLMLRRTVNRIGLESFCENPYTDQRLDDVAYATVQIDGNSPHILINRLDNPPDKKIRQYAQTICRRQRYAGSIHSLVYITKHRNSHTLIIFMGNIYAWEISKNLIYMSVLFGFLGILLLFFISIYLTFRLTRPAAKAFEAQQDFISDASHELKTPLTIISTNTELLEQRIGGNQQTEYILHETQRMNSLINQLLTLARADSHQETTAYSDFSLSDAWMETVLPFESIAYRHQTSLDIRIAPDIRFHGIREQLQQLISILLDNAISHTQPDGKIRISASCQHKKITLSVSNTGAPIPVREQEKIFDRFYRTDKARSDTEEHYGLGLSIARTIVNNYHGRITVHCQDGWITFRVVLRAP